MSDEAITSSDDVIGLRMGAIVTVKGKLESVRWNPPREEPSISIAFSDWSMISINVVDEATARSIKLPLRTDVVVKARVIDEDCTLEALALWAYGGAPIPLARTPCLYAFDPDKIEIVEPRRWS